MVFSFFSSALSVFLDLSSELVTIAVPEFTVSPVLTLRVMIVPLTGAVIGLAA